MIFFDIDDTLLDHKLSEYLGVLDFFHKYKSIFTLEVKEFYSLWTTLSRMYFEQYLNNKLSFQQQRRERIKELFTYASKTICDEEADIKFEDYLLAYENNWKPFDDVLPCLERLQDYKLGIISNGDLEQQTKKLHKLGIMDYFSSITTAGDVGVAKPNREIFQVACQRAGVLPQESFYIGDDLENDILACNAVNMTGIWLNRNKLHRPEDTVQVINNLEELYIKKK